MSAKAQEFYSRFRISSEGYSLKGAFMMEYSNTGVTEFAIGLPTEDERKKLKDDGYTHMSNGITVEEHPQSYEIWMR